MYKTPLFLLMTILYASSCIAMPNNNQQRAEEIIDSLYRHYAVEGSPLLNENYPMRSDYKASYLATEDTTTSQKVAYLWPFSGTFSAVNALLKLTKDEKYKTMLEERVLAGLDLYFDTTRLPVCYQSYIVTAPLSDRFYDDNVWIANDFLEAYHLTRNVQYLDKSKEVWQFIMSGCDDELGGGIYWCEQKKRSKNTCSNAPASVLALKLFETTKDSTFFHQGLELYNWTQTTLQDTSDKLYFDNKSLRGKIGKEKYAYNSGQMLQAAVLLYNLTGNKAYLTEAQAVAQACVDYFAEDYTSPEGKTFKLFRKRNTWFMAIMFRGFVELYHIDNNRKYLDIFQANLNHLWVHVRDNDGLFYSDWSGETKDDTKWLLSQAALVEMYATLALFD